MASTSGRNCQADEKRAQEETELLGLYKNYICNDRNNEIVEIMVSRLAKSGGNRRYYRLSGGEGYPSAVGVIGTSLKENSDFIRLAKKFRSAKANVPEIYGVGESGMTYLQQDLGDTPLFRLITSHEPAGEEGRELWGTDTDYHIEDALRQLVILQTQTFDHDDSDVIKWRRQIHWDLNYFKYEFLKVAGEEFDEGKLEDDFDRLSDVLTHLPEDTYGFMYRDFQSRNVMVSVGKSWLIDFQGGMWGPAMYDAVSFAYQAKAGFSEAYRQSIIDRYIDIYREYNTHASRQELERQTKLMALLRTLQVCGAYGFRGLVEKRAHFIESIPGALRNLKKLVDTGVMDTYPTLKEICCRLIENPRFKGDDREGLRVQIFSFSYKKGYPEDLSGNGGGFMFDCRAMHNPGRYAEYRQLTGRDEPVIRFLEERGEVQEFVADAYSLTSKAVRRYLNRGFSNLQIGFGCTGGQHRSVYCAERLAKMLREAFPEARIELRHREQE